MQPVQLSLIPDPSELSPAVRRSHRRRLEQLPAEAAATAIALLANVIAKAAAPRGWEVAGDE